MTSQRQVLQSGVIDSSYKSIVSFRWQRFVAPLVVFSVLAGLLLWVSSLDLDTIEMRTLNREYLSSRVLEHLSLAVLASAVVAVLAVPLGVLLAKAPSALIRTAVLAIANIGQSTPAVGVVIILALVWKTGYLTALVALIVYAFLPVLRNTMVGIEQVDPKILEAARGMGMSVRQAILRVELPLAIPVVLAGVRTSLVFSVGVATVATFINAGGLGDVIVNGLKLQRLPVIVVGAVLVACIALIMDWVAGIVEEACTPKGI